MKFSLVQTLLKITKKKLPKKQQKIINSRKLDEAPDRKNEVSERDQSIGRRHANLFKMLMIPMCIYAQQKSKAIQ